MKQSCASSWTYLRDYTKMQSQQNIKFDRGHFPLSSSDQHANLTTGIRVVLRAKMRGAAPSLPHVPEHFA